MAVRIRSRFHSGGRQRTQAELASVIAMLAWKLAIDSIKRMREAEYDIDIGRPYFGFVCEYLVFLAQAADRIAYRELEPAQRAEFTSALAVRLADVVEDNRDMLLGEEVPGESRRFFLELFNRRGGEYAAFDYAADGPDFGFRRCFAAGIEEVLPAKDKLWAIDQVMEIEVPEAIKALEKTLAGLFASDDEDTPRRPRRDAVTGE
jgi:hypothetical protein